MLISKNTIFIISSCTLLMIAAAPTCELACGDSQCVSASDRCDNVMDCENKSDEKDCDYLHDCPTGQFMCRSGECMPPNSKCNGTWECGDGSDETGCRAISIDTNSLPTAADFEDEMKHTSLPPSRPVEERIKPKKRSCNPRNASLYFTNNEVMIYGAELTGTSSKKSELLVSSTSGTIRSLSVDFERNELLYVADRISNEIRAVDPENKHDRVLIEQKSQRFSCIAKDWITNNIYFAEDGVGIGICLEAPRVLRGDVQVQCMMLVDSSPTDRHHYRDLILHPRRGSMMWIQDEPLGVLKIAGMDGSMVRTLSYFEHVHAIAFDYEQENLYVAEGSTLDVMDIRTLKRDTIKSIKPFSIAYYNCEIFYIERETNMLKKLVEGGDDLFVMALSGLHFKMTMSGQNATIGHERTTDPCTTANCAEFCTLTESFIEPAAKCHCIDCRKEDPVTEHNVLKLIIGILGVLFFSFVVIAFIVIYFRLCPVMCRHVDRWMDKDIGANESNISVGYNNPAFK